MKLFPKRSYTTPAVTSQKWVWNVIKCDSLSWVYPSQSKTNDLSELLNDLGPNMTLYIRQGQGQGQDQKPLEMFITVLSLPCCQQG